MDINAVIVLCEKAQATRKVLEREGVWDSSRRMVKHGKGKVAIPVRHGCRDMIDIQIEEIFQKSSDTALKDLMFETADVSLPLSRKSRTREQTPYRKLVDGVSSIMAHLDLSSKWCRFFALILFSLHTWLPSRSKVLYYLYVQTLVKYQELIKMISNCTLMRN